jgi:outer membrane protein TolC
MSLPAQLVRQRPDVLASEANLRAMNAQIGVAVANRLPQVSLNANLGSSASAFNTLFGAGTMFWGLTGNVLQPIFDAGALAAKQTAAEEYYNQAMAQYRSVVLVAFQNVADALRAQQADARALTAAIAAEEAAAQSLELVRKQLELGQVSQPIILAAQQAYLQTATARVQAQALRLADAVALFQALGGGWWNRPQFSPKPKDESSFPPLIATEERT